MSTSPYLNGSTLEEYNQPQLFLVFLEGCSPTTWFYKIHLPSWVAFTPETTHFCLLANENVEMLKKKGCNKRHLNHRLERVFWLLHIVPSFDRVKFNFLSTSRLQISLYKITSSFTFLRWVQWLLFAGHFRDKISPICKMGVLNYNP